MKKNIWEFVRRGLPACGIGPIILAVVYLIMWRHAGLETLSVDKVCIGIVSLTVLAFIAGGMNFIYQIERLPLMVAILIHGGVLYVSYLITYLLNGWLKTGGIPLLVFSVVFVIGYFAIWAIIYLITKRNTSELNEMLKQNQQNKGKESAE